MTGQDRASLVDHPRSSFGVVVGIVKVWLASPPLGVLPALPRGQRNDDASGISE
jgi:hypothetical protein